MSTLSTLSTLSAAVAADLRPVGAAGAVTGGSDSGLLSFFRPKYGKFPVGTIGESPRPTCGRRVCAWCVPMRDLGPAPDLAAGETTHGICEECARALVQEEPR